MTELSTPSSPNLATPFLPAAATAELEDWGPLDEATGDPMTTAGYTLWEQGEASAGIWECSPGPSRWLLETNEFIYLLAGSMTVTPDGGEPFEATAGSTFFTPKGWSGTWDIHETLRKVYVIF
jgi:uncharacterized protein